MRTHLAARLLGLAALCMALAVVLIAASASPAESDPASNASPNLPATTFIIIRHAEKAGDGGTDPGLSEAGAARAVRLAEALKNAGVDAVYFSNTRRAEETAQPAIDTLKIPAERRHEYRAASGAAAAEALAVQLVKDAASSGARTVLLVGHSNTVPELVNALGRMGGGKSGPETWNETQLAESDFDTLYIVTLGAGPPRMIRAGHAPAQPPQVE